MRLSIQYVRFAAVLVCLSALSVGCFRANRAVVQKDDLAILSFTGSITEVSFTLERDDGQLAVPRTWIEEGKRYSVSPGVAVLTVERDGKTVVRRKLYLVSGQTSEVQLP